VILFHVEKSEVFNQKQLFYWRKTERGC
jgi:hypothetical protein